MQYLCIQCVQYVPTTSHKHSTPIPDLELPSSRAYKYAHTRTYILHTTYSKLGTVGATASSATRLAQATSKRHSHASYEPDDVWCAPLPAEHAAHISACVSQHRAQAAVAPTKLPAPATQAAGAGPSPREKMDTDCRWEYSSSSMPAPPRPWPQHDAPTDPTPPRASAHRNRPAVTLPARRTCAWC